ncbi:nuclease SbcCD subunit C (plasmid) [Cupriavidus sp. USMAHM13]|uniref:nuclease SbcCD subunit C n=1 Tax=Cupriavidus sp. USMAHM13 TaxID=1389192 RepID=UPI0008A6899B|nr:nuclease SbcCD subunit C [Cupriavidus sp. USMAHM13]AOZ04202.1 nuclease SbcCD subunit C [Cupriavidus sp. USMAHM13]
MRPLKLTLTGFIGVRDGMRRESVTLDLASLPAGLIALTGPNGAGKTTLMDNLHPYPIMPSHASKMSADAFSYWDHLYGSRGEKDLEWEHADKLYRSVFSFRNPGKSRKAEYYLFEKAADGSWKPLELPDGLMSDGKADSYNRCLDAVLGSPEAFFMSVFSAQNRRPIASYQASEIKRLLAELLGLEHLRDLSAKAGDVAKGLQRHLDAVQRDLLLLSGRRDHLTRLAADIGQAESSLATARQQRDAETAHGAKLLQERATVAAKQSASAAAEARLRELKVRDGELAARRRQLEADARDAGTRSAARQRELTQIVSARQAVLAEGEAIRTAGAQRDALQMALSGQQGEVAGQQEAIARLEALQLQHTALKSDLQGLEGRGASAAQLVQSLKGQVSVMDTVPCHGHPMHDACPLLVQARQAKVQLSEQTISLTQLRTSYKAKVEAMKPIAAALEELASQRKRLTALQAEVARGQQELQRLAALAAKKPMLDVAQEGLSQAQRDLAVLAEEDDRRQARHVRDVHEVDHQREVIHRELVTLSHVDVTGVLAELDLKLKASREEIVALDGRIEALIRQQATFSTERERVEAELAGMPGVQGKAERLSDEIARWKLLAKGLGNDGVIALSIDDAGPALTGIVNDLLLACYGPRFTIAIHTQTALANGEKREGFEIRVHDADNDSEKDFAHMSGGQKIWVNECLTRGIGLYRAQDSGQSFHTLFTDEADGPLDPERKRAFMRMKREVLKQGGYEREFFISHTPESVDEADAVIDVAALAVA